MNELTVQVQNLVVRFGSFTAVNDISFEVQQGEIFGFLGANGAGKTTTLRVLTGLLVPTAGKVKVVGIPLSTATALQVKSRVGYMSQKFTLYNDLSVQGNLRFSAALRKMPADLALQRQNELLQFIDFKAAPSTIVRDLPAGMKQQVALANALIHDPDIIFLDEPTAGVSPAARGLFWKLIRRLSQQGKSVFVTSHYMDEVEQCHRIALMRAGEIIALDSPPGLKQSTFPGKVYELEFLVPIEREELAQWKTRGLFGLFDPYGIHYHVTVHNEDLWKKFQMEQKSRVSIREIEPSLEDVFIHRVEGQNQ